MPQFTKMAIINSFYKLIEQKSFEKISVKDIVEDCGVNRKTFYYYFSDIYDLVEQIFRMELNKYIENLTEEITLEQGMTGVFNLLEKNKKAIYHIHNSTEKDDLKKYIYGSLHDVIVKINRENAKKYGISEKDMELLCSVFIMAFSGLINTWIDNGMKPSYYETIKRVCVMLRGSAELMLNNLRSEDNENSDKS